MDYVVPPLPHTPTQHAQRLQFTLRSSEQNIQISNGPSVNVHEVSLRVQLIY